jgi:putative endonuclease
VTETFYVYILATRKDGPIYVGITNDVHRRVFEHKTHAVRGFTAKYNVDRLVYFEAFDSVEEAIAREKRIEKSHRAVEGGADRAREPRVARLGRGVRAVRFHVILDGGQRRSGIAVGLGAKSNDPGCPLRFGWDDESASVRRSRIAALPRPG